MTDDATTAALPLRTIVYSSRATVPIDPHTLQSIMLASYRNNAVDGVHGHLFFTGAAFVQVIEGVAKAVGETMSRIARDPRHEMIDLHHDAMQATPRFTSWNMRAVTIPTDVDAALAIVADVLPADLMPFMAPAVRAACGVPVDATQGFTPPPSAVDIVHAFEQQIKDAGYPCVGAKSAIAKRQMTAYVGRSVVSAWDDTAIIVELVRFAHDYAIRRNLFRTFVAFFPESPMLDEEAFEAALWDRVASLRAKDAWLGQNYDASVSHDPASPNFSLSFGEQAFFIVGLHPAASRPARRFRCPVLVFNLHDQFEQLRAQGRYETIRETILERDAALAGSVNPMLARHGEASEARQYSGRLVGPDWECPYPGGGPIVPDDEDERA